MCTHIRKIHHSHFSLVATEAFTFVMMWDPLFNFLSLKKVYGMERDDARANESNVPIEDPHKRVVGNGSFKLGRCHCAQQ